MGNYRNYCGRPIRGSYRARVCEDVDYGGEVPKVLTREWVMANIPNDATEVEIPYGVMELGNDCFWCYSSLESINIPDSVKTFGESCFFGCERLRSINIPEGVTSIGKDCFMACASLHSITIPDSVTSLGDDCFWGCVSLGQIKIPHNLTKLGAVTFYGCTSLKTITIPGNIKSVGECCFQSCSSLESVKISEGVKEIGEECFASCDALKSLSIPRSLTTIGHSCLSGCDSFRDVYYAGSQRDRNNIEIDTWSYRGMTDNRILNATWHYNSKGVNERFYINRRTPRHYIRESAELGYKRDIERVFGRGTLIDGDEHGGDCVYKFAGNRFALVLDYDMDFQDYCEDDADIYRVCDADAGGVAYFDFDNNDFWLHTYTNDGEYPYKNVSEIYGVLDDNGYDIDYLKRLFARYMNKNESLRRRSISESRRYIRR